MDAKTAQKTYYTHQFKKYGASDIRAMGWHETDEYPVRFEQALSLIDENESVLDVGCGFGDLFEALKGRSPTVDYLGIDILEEMVDVARSKHGLGNFNIADMNSDQLPKKDVVIAIGSFNIDGPDHQNFFWASLEHLLALANKKVIISLLTNKRYIARGPYFIIEKAEFTKECEKRFAITPQMQEDDRVQGETFFILQKDS